MVPWAHWILHSVLFRTSYICIVPSVIPGWRWNQWFIFQLLANVHSIEFTFRHYLSVTTQKRNSKNHKIKFIDGIEAYVFVYPHTWYGPQCPNISHCTFIILQSFTFCIKIDFWRSQGIKELWALDNDNFCRTFVAWTSSLKNSWNSFIYKRWLKHCRVFVLQYLFAGFSRSKSHLNTLYHAVHSLASFDSEVIKSWLIRDCVLYVAFPENEIQLLEPCHATWIGASTRLFHTLCTKRFSDPNLIPKFSKRWIPSFFRSELTEKVPSSAGKMHLSSIVSQFWKSIIEIE